LANVYAIVVGRLVEVRIEAAVLTPADVDTWFNGVAAAMSRLPKGQRGVVVADWRGCPRLSDEAATRAAARLTQANPIVERSAALASSESPITVLQFLRLCRDTNPSGNRQLFTNPHEMKAWLSERLTPLEIGRLQTFLEEPARRGTSAR
jgi:hypothetical protein